MADTSPPTHPPVPEGYKVHTENTAHVLLPSSDEAFLNPIQEFNRDLSVACITVWSEESSEIKEAAWVKKRERQKNGGVGRKRRKIEGESVAEGAVVEQTDAAAAEPVDAQPQPQKESQYVPYKFTILEALSATGLRSIRYAKEIPLVRYVIANDLSPAATEAMRRNIAFNGLSAPAELTDDQTAEKSKHRVEKEKIQVNQGDACSLMYQHREDRHRVDVVDLDPYGTAAPFIDAGIQCVNDGGLLCVTCTDLTVLATNNYPEKCFSNYGGVSLKGEYCHESALRLVLHALSTSAGRYGRYIVPMLSLSIDFYVRVFVKVFSKPEEVKKASVKTSAFYVCSGCQAHYEQPFVRMTEKVNEKTGNVNRNYKIHAGPTVSGAPTAVVGDAVRTGSDKCPECESTLHMAGPMWAGPLHDPAFIGRVLKHVEAEPAKYGTSSRMQGMLTVAQSELDTHFYFTPSQVASAFKCECPPLDKIASALLHAGHDVSRSHACGGSLKTTASRAEVYDIYRSWIKTHPVKMENVPEKSPARVLLAKEPRAEANFKHHPKSVTTSTAGGKLVMYQQNPKPMWGPGSRASGKRKRDAEQPGEPGDA
jgi:tRNA (guanine26-N2/guanine27-N2)-dimethyltransferase